MSSKYKFYLGLLGEILTSPYAYSKNFIKWKFTKAKANFKPNKFRIPVNSNKLAVCIHEWGGYQGKRVKNIKNIQQFECGLDYQLERFKNYHGKYELDLTLTISDVHLFKGRTHQVKVIGVDNIGMDFSGYESFFNTIKDKENQYVLLTNSSIHKDQHDFIDGYLDFFKANKNIGMMGVSFNTKMYQSLIRNNFTPHLQSFFLLTTTHVLKEVVAKNTVFPGKGIDYKLALIKNGEIKLSRIVMDLGYSLACVLEDGKTLIFDSSCMIDNGRNSWNSYFGDYRLFLKKPNSIPKIEFKN